MSHVNISVGCEKNCSGRFVRYFSLSRLSNAFNLIGVQSGFAFLGFSALLVIDSIHHLKSNDDSNRPVG